MIRTIGSALVGYVVTFVAVFGLMTAAWMAVGAEGAFLPGVWDVTGVWLLLMLAASLAAAVAGGYVTRLLALDPAAVTWLIGIVIVLGVIFAIPVVMGSMPSAPLPRPDDLPMMEAMTNGTQPAWVDLLNPLLGAVGVWVGGKLRSRQSTERQGAD